MLGEEARAEYSIKLAPLEEFRQLDALILAVAYHAYGALPIATLAGMIKPGGGVIDVKSALNPAQLPNHLLYWSL